MWCYIAGYFDGEGHVAMHPQKRGGYTRALSWYNSHLESLEAMQRFMGCGFINRTKEAKGGPVYTLSLTNKRDMLYAIENMLPYLIVKKAAALRLQEALAEIRGVPNRGKIAKISTEVLLKWYNEDGLSQAEIAERVGVSVNAVCKSFQRRGIDARRGRFAEGHVRSEESRRRQAETLRQRWADPEFRERRTEQLRQGFAARRARRREE